MRIIHFGPLLIALACCYTPLLISQNSHIKHVCITNIALDHTIMSHHIASHRIASHRIVSHRIITKATGVTAASPGTSALRIKKDLSK